MLDTFHVSDILFLPPSLPKECPDSPPALDMSLHVFVYDMREDMQDMDFIIDDMLARFSDFLAGEEKKACDEIFLKSHHYLYSKLCYTLSDATQKFLDADCGNRHRYRDYLKFFAYYYTSLFHSSCGFCFSLNSLTSLHISRL